MDISKFQGVKVLSRFDGIGFVESISENKTSHISIKFNNGAKKNFTIPLAFASGLLSTENPSLTEYLNSLSKNRASIAIIKANDDIPSADELHLKISTRPALTEQRLALLGILDDTYQLYNDIHALIEKKMLEQSKQSCDRRGKEFDGQIHWNFSKSIENELQKMIQSPLNRHLSIYTNEYNTLNFSGMPFQKFIWRYRKHFPQSFSDFCVELEILYVDSIFEEKSKYEFRITEDKVYHLVNTRIQVLYLLAKQKTFRSCDVDKIFPKDCTLHVAESLSSTECHRQNHSILTKSYAVSLINSNNYVMLPVHYCSTCHRYFIGGKTLSEYEKCHGKLSIMRKKYSDSSSPINSPFINFNSESLLHQYGYNVRAGELTESARRAILVRLIENHQLSYHEICRTIEQNISLFQGNPHYFQAVSKWKSDLKFIGDYVKELK